eukprot:GHVS01042175.1.p1 GENE.GHVS01042175.1~~GHVS01042175.1.p1  ORF type:complete len:327 (-),score=121.56 GHVS01042175.1:4-837(-)
MEDLEKDVAEMYNNLETYGGDEDLLALVLELKKTEEQLQTALGDLQDVDTRLQKLSEEQPKIVEKEGEMLSVRQKHYDKLKDENQILQEQLTQLTHEQLSMAERDEVITSSSITQEICELKAVEEKLLAQRKLFSKEEWEEIATSVQRRELEGATDELCAEGQAVDLKSEGGAELALLSSLSCLKILEQSETSVKLHFSPPVPRPLGGGEQQQEEEQEEEEQEEAGDYEVVVDGSEVLFSPPCPEMQQLLQRKLQESTNPCWALKQVLSTAAVRTLS